MDQTKSLIEVTENGDINELTKLIEAKANIDIQDNFGDTALIWTSSKGHFDCTTKLIEAKANIDIQDNNNETALMRALHNGNLNVPQN